ncbi:MAG: hypothetical protein ACRCYU_18385 [Nocardioides sp.]
MTAERHELLDELPDGQVAAALADVRRRLPQSPEFFGVVEGADIPTDLARNVDDYLAASGFGRDSL